jgi:signal peptidase I
VSFEEHKAPDVHLSDLVVFQRPDIRVDQFVRYETPRAKGHLREWSESLIFTIIFIFIFTSYIAQATQVPTESMKPTILVGDHFFIDKVAFPGNFPQKLHSYLPARSVKRGDVIVFKSPVEGNIPFVKRVIGMPGDKVQIRNKAVYINDQKLAEPYKIHVDTAIYRKDRWSPTELIVRDNYGPHKVPANSFFVLGDNRDNSNDSRYWGFVRADAVMGKPLFVYWSYESDPYIGPDRNLSDWLNGYLTIAMHFFDRTRWFRIGTMVD